jgi:protein-tyrosine phosphatase
MTEKPNIPVVCERNKRRSRTAEHGFKNDPGFNIRSAGLSPKSGRKISESDLNWANLAFAMENDQRTKISELYGHLDLPIVEVLNIPVDSCLMDAGLIELLTDGINGTLKRVYKI